MTADTMVTNALWARNRDEGTLSFVEDGTPANVQECQFGTIAGDSCLRRPCTAVQSQESILEKEDIFVAGTLKGWIRTYE